MKIKKVFYLLFFSILFVLIGCRQDDIINSNDNKLELKSNETEFAGLRVKLSERYDKRVLNVSVADLQNELFRSFSSQGRQLSKSSDDISISTTALSFIIDSVTVKYPDVYRLSNEDVEAIKSNFVGLTNEDIIQNICVIDSFYNTFMRYEIIKKIQQDDEIQFSRVGRYDKKAKASADYYGYSLNSKEFWYIVKHPLLKEPIEKAAKKATELTISKFGRNAGADKSDAFRHAMWNVLIAKYVGVQRSHSSISSVLEVAATFTGLHESGTTKPNNFTNEQWLFDRAMDYHNNGQGRNYFRNVAWIHRHQTWFYTLDKIRAPSEEDMANAIYQKAIDAKKVFFSYEIGSYPNNLVYIKD